MITTDAPATGTDSGWKPLSRMTFRFCVVYFGLYCLLVTPMWFPVLGLLNRWTRHYTGPWLPLTDPVTGWVGSTVFGVDAVLRRDSGAGDQMAVWVLVFCLFVVAMVATSIWTFFERAGSSPRLLAWFTLFVRVLLAGQMVSFGFAKVFLYQMPGPALAQLLQPYGELSPASVLWLQVGSSHPYEMTLGAVEVVAGLLLFVPRTAVLGAALSLASMAQVLLLNLTFDIPEKLLAGHLLLFSVFLLAPYLRRLIDVFVRQRACAPLTQPALFADDRRNRVAVWLQVALGIWIVVGSGFDGWTVWQRQNDADRLKSELYGIWEVREFSVDGHPIPPLTTDPNRWQRIVFDAPEAATYQRMNGELVPARAEFGPDARFDLTTIDEKAGQQTPFATLAADRSDRDHLVLRGQLHDRPVVITLDRVDHDAFTLRSRGFHWVQDYPYFR